MMTTHQPPADGAADRHLPVMPAEVAEHLAPALSADGAVHVDGTLGLGGHAEAVLSAHPGVRLVGIDRASGQDQVHRPTVSDQPR